MSALRTCPFCRTEFRPSKYHPGQNVCSARECQQKRRAAFHRTKLVEDPAYAEACRDSRKKWRDKSKHQLAEYRKSRRLHLARTAQDRLGRQRKELLDLIDRCSAFNLRNCTAQVWLICAGNKTQVEKILATDNLLILHVELSSSLSDSKG